MIVVSYATDDSHYRPFRERLIASCERFGLRHDIGLLKPWGVGSQWEASQQQCCHKPEYIRRCMIEHDSPLLWVDVDTVFFRPPVLGEGGDVGFVDNPYGNRIPMTGGAIVFWSTEGAMRFLCEWRALCDARKPGELADHIRLLQASESVDADYRDVTENLRGTLELWARRGKHGKRL